MNRAYKFRLYPKREQIDTLEKTLMLCRKLYNAGLEEKITAYRMAEKNISYYEQKRELVKVKDELPEYTVIYSHVLQDVIGRLDNAYRAFFRRVKNGETAGFPRFKGGNRFRSVTYDRYGFWLMDNGHLKVSKVGEMRMFKHREIEGTPKICIIKKDAVGDWWATITATIPDVPRTESKTAIGVDVGLKNLALLSTGERIEPPKFLRASEEKIKIVQREVSRKKKGGNNRKKCVRRLAKVHRRVERQRDDFLHKTSRMLSQKADVIVFENLNINGMLKNHHLAKSIGDASWGKLMQYTTYKAEDAGKSVEFINPNGTSQICSQCGETVKKSLSERFHVCTNCGFETDRDFNASLNILERLHTDSVELLKTPVESRPPQLPNGGCEFGR